MRTNEPAHQVRTGVMRFARRLRQQRPANELGITGLAVLGRLDRDGESTATALAAAERIQPQSLTRLLATMQEGGLIERVADPSDRRRNLIRITERARAMLADDRRGRDRWLAEAMEAQLTEAECARLLEVLPLLDKLVEYRRDNE